VISDGLRADKTKKLIPRQLPPQCLLESAESSGVSENPRGYSDSTEAERLQKDSRENGNGGGQVASPAKAVPCGDQTPQNPKPNGATKTMKSR
jgi:hypothetical protein